MTINLRQELERLVEGNIKRGPYKAVDEFVECAIKMLHEHEEWLQANRTEISAAVDKGYAAARRGELIDGDQVQAQMQERKGAWRDDRRQQ